MAKSVASGYRHYDKHVSPGPIMQHGDMRLKWYSIADLSSGVSDEITTLARNFLETRSNANELGDCGDLGFVILHRCGAQFYFLLLMGWKNSNELWESVYAKRSDMEDDFSDFEFDSKHRGTFCVWELAVVAHEKDSWKRFLLSDQRDADEQVYMSDSLCCTA